VTEDLLVPVLITFLIVNVVLLVRAWATGQFRGPRTASAEEQPGGALAGASVAPEPAEQGVAEAPAASAAPALSEPMEPGAAVVPGSPVPAAHEAASPSAAPASLAAPDPAASPAAPIERNPMSGLGDEATWERRVADEHARLMRYRRPVTIVRLELEGLDRLVGLLGDDAGDRLLQAMAGTLRRLARDTDHVAHLGHGRFGVLMPETPEDAAVAFVERVRRSCELWLESSAIAVRLAIGWASTSGEPGLDEVQRLAIERMHRGPWPEARRADTRSYPGPGGRRAAQLPVADMPPAMVPGRSWETCRDPNCNHKDDHRRDRHP
jgi:diguanylate cyclase (GGDEF)-like protein